MTGTRRAALTAVLFAAALVFLVVAIATHNAIPLFVMWVPLLAVPLVLGRADPSTGLESEEGSTPQGGATEAVKEQGGSENEPD